MSIADRKLKEKQDMHKLILDAARKIFMAKGYDKTSVRNIAREIDYSLRRSFTNCIKRVFDFCFYN